MMLDSPPTFKVEVAGLENLGNCTFYEDIVFSIKVTTDYCSYSLFKNYTEVMKLNMALSQLFPEFVLNFPLEKLPVKSMRISAPTNTKTVIKDSRLIESIKSKLTSLNQYFRMLQTVCIF